MKENVRKLNAVLTEMTELAEKFDALLKQDRDNWDNDQWDEYDVIYYRLNDLTDEWNMLKYDIDHNINMVGQW